MVISKPLDKSQWLVVIGIFFPVIIELVALFSSFYIQVNRRNKIYTSVVLKYLIAVFFISGLIIYHIGYGYSKYIQQIVALLMFFLLYEQFFINNRYSLSGLFQKYIIVVYYFCVIGLFQECVYLVTRINILSLLPGYHATHLIFNGLLRVTSTLSEGGWLGPVLVPSLIYLFYYNDPLIILRKKRWIVFLTSLLTLSPFVYVALFAIFLIRFHQKFVYVKKIVGCLIICFASYVVYNIIQQDNHENQSGVNSIFMRISDTYKVVSNINEDELADVLKLSGNASTSVIATNMYIGINAPSRLFGTGIGTNAQSYHDLVDVDTSFEFNPDDGYSLFNRILSEFGVVGLILYISFIIKHFNRYNMINVCFFFMILSLFLRGGNYMLYGTVFIHFFYYYTSKSSKYIIKVNNGEANIHNNCNL